MGSNPNPLPLRGGGWEPQARGQVWPCQRQTPGAVWTGLLLLRLGRPLRWGARGPLAGTVFDLRDSAPKLQKPVFCVQSLLPVLSLRAEPSREQKQLLEIQQLETRSPETIPVPLIHVSLKGGFLEGARGLSRDSIPSGEEPPGHPFLGGLGEAGLGGNRKEEKHERHCAKTKAGIRREFKTIVSGWELSLSICPTPLLILFWLLLAQVSTTKIFRDLAAVPSHTASQRVPVKRQASESTELDFKGCPVGMRVFITILLAALLCLNQGSGQKEREWADESKDDYYDYKEYDEDDDEEDEEEDTKIKHIPYEGSLECYTCESVPNEESCNKIQTCPSAKSFCKTIISKGNAESKFFTTYSAWCSDTCQEATKIIDGTHVTMSCCQFDLCNPLWIKGRVPRLRAKGSSNCGGILMSLGVVILGMLGRDL
ncbi:glycosylphosphatidylinositol-anchored high density lipoprotein-binding protein 1 [Gracilinanus agilis]|uniref:glycosylphosphatidylinositol-anchored high density lipoprotein-binding protein 1 n=1 Tax=Gracilinanus agilis TaxID=191870 RepID=UPI001CFE89FB|nr:glycosylphosphatidylinositol-anchored high density lipoprotein-binding protein 1 [Gracilinanus agilis]